MFVDNGLLRLHEGDQVMQVFAENMGVKVIRVDAEDRFLTALRAKLIQKLSKSLVKLHRRIADAARDVSQGSDGKPAEFCARYDLS